MNNRLGNIFDSDQPPNNLLDQALSKEPPVLLNLAAAVAQRSANDKVESYIVRIMGIQFEAMHAEYELAIAIGMG